MGVGCEVYDANGRKTFDASNYMLRVFGTVDTGVVPGSLTNTNFSNSGMTPFSMYFPTSQGATPNVTISGNVLSWSWPTDNGAGNRCNGYIVYGVY